MVVAAAVLGSGFAAQAQVVLAEGFENVTGLSASGWQLVNTSPSPGSTWFQGNAGIFGAASGTPASYAAVNFLGTTAASGPITNWLITPQLQLDASSTVSLAIRTAGDGFFDRVDVLRSTTGTAAGDFSLIGSYGSASDQGWINLSFGAALNAAAPAYIAFRYVVDDVATSGNYLGIDNVLITAVPEPTTTLLIGLGLAGLLARRRFSA